MGGSSNFTFFFLLAVLGFELRASSLQAGILLLESHSQPFKHLSVFQELPGIMLRAPCGHHIHRDVPCGNVGKESSLRR
jgi:hypothetical protein